MFHTLSRHKRMPHKERQGESRVREIRMHGLVEEVSPKKRNLLRSMGFTLLELLIVIAIIAILASMFFPALKKGMEKSREIACASNLKQVGLSFSMYTADNTYFPVTCDGVSVWVELLLNCSYLNSSKILACPTFASDYPSRSTIQKQGFSGYESYPHYGYNRAFIGGDSRPAEYKATARPENIKRSSSTLVIADARISLRNTNFNIAGYYRLEYSKDTGSGTVWNAFLDARHTTRGVNVLWADIHANTVHCTDTNPYNTITGTLFDLK